MNAKVCAFFIIVSVAVLTACSGNEAGRDAVSVNEHPASHYANMYIDGLLAQGLNVAVFDEPDGYFTVRPANILDRRINTLEKQAKFDDMAEYPLEMWRLDFTLLTDDIEDGEGLLRWGTFSPDSDGWIGHHTAWNDAHIFLVFLRKETGVSYVGYIPWRFELHNNAETLEGKETLLRKWLMYTAI